MFSAAIWYGISRFESFLAWMESRIPSWLQWLDWILWPLFVLVLVILVFYGFTLVANLLASPFNGLLSEKVELHLTGRSLEEDGGWKQALVTLVPTLFDELRKLLFAAFLAVPFLLLVADTRNQPGCPCPLVSLHGLELTLEYSDYPMGNHGLKFREMCARLRKQPVLGLGFSSATVGLTMLPVLNFIVMPSAVAGATALWVDELSEQPAKSKRV